ncbi:hypothetical protein M422DRAFT_30081 [Sphaerobolus stellatus SS14]|uniref:Ribosomal protein/NADH dehydrogenase domain-containing protein n=1 Tax=Sphaerobolus stellatus (strain SS14) TaxID=990650 RepID=A0A0C9VS00_SPHS4|nr:hypothetical protein M422DRAFT_30081 [Sphaerobolus stellatus SS14]
MSAVARGPSKLALILRQLKQEPRPILSSVQSLHCTYASKNDHFGARHFGKEYLPRIAYNNPDVQITVSRPLKKPEESLLPVIDITLLDGTKRTVEMAGKQSNIIFDELLNLNKTVAAKVAKATGSIKKGGRSFTKTRRIL